MMTLIVELGQSEDSLERKKMQGQGVKARRSPRITAIST